ncbi:MAG: hypothetical protein ACC633_02690 [Anaerolineales bacterium]
MNQAVNNFPYNIISKISYNVTAQIKACGITCLLFQIGLMVVWRQERENMPIRNTPKRKKRSYPPFWERFIPVALILIVGIIAFLIYITIRVALGLAALPF